MSRVTGASGDPDLGRVLGLVGRWWLLLIVAAGLGGWTAYAVGSRTAATYEAKAGVLVGPVGGDFNELRAAGQEAQTLAQVAVSRPVLRAAQRRAGAASEGPLTGERVGATADEATRLLTIVARAGDPRHAAVIANAVASEIPTAAGRVGRTVAVVDPAQPPLLPVGTGAKALAAIGGLASMLLVLMLLLVHDHFRGRIVRETDLTDITGAANLANLRRPRRGGSMLASRARALSAADYRLLAGRVRLAAPKGGLRSVVVAGADAGETSADVAANLATALAAEDLRVVLVDADHRSRAITRLLGLEGRAGVGDLLDDPGEKRKVSDVTVEQGTRLRVLPYGNGEAQHSLDARATRLIIERLLEDADIVVVATAPAGISAAALAWVGSAEGTVLLARRGSTPREAILRAGEAIADVRGRLLGTALAQRTRLTRERRSVPTPRLTRPRRPLPVARAAERTGEAPS